MWRQEGGPPPHKTARRGNGTPAYYKQSSDDQAGMAGAAERSVRPADSEDIAEVSERYQRCDARLLTVTNVGPRLIDHSMLRTLRKSSVANAVLARFGSRAPPTTRASRAEGG